MKSQWAIKNDKPEDSNVLMLVPAEINKVRLTAMRGFFQSGSAFLMDSLTVIAKKIFVYER